MLDIPTVGVLMISPGASSKEIESQIVETLESTFQELENVDRITTEIRGGYMYSTIKFEFGEDVEKKNEEVLAKLGD